MKGRVFIREELEHDRPQFDFIGKLMEWAQSKDMKQHKGYFYIDYLVDMEGYPESMREELNPTPEEHLHLRLVSLAEERRFWKAFFFYQEQYEFENKHNVFPEDVSRTANLEHCLRMAGIASPAVLAVFQDWLVDDHTLLCVDRKCRYADTKLVGDLISFLTGRAIGDMLASLDVPRDGLPALLQALEDLRRFPVEVVDTSGNLLASEVFSFRDVPSLTALLDRLALHGGLQSWYIDVRNFYSTPGHMLFTDYEYQNFLLDWWLQGKWQWGGARCGNSKVIVMGRRSPQEEVEARRGWYNVI